MTNLSTVVCSSHLLRGESLHKLEWLQEGAQGVDGDVGVNCARFASCRRCHQDHQLALHGIREGIKLLLVLIPGRRVAERVRLQRGKLASVCVRKHALPTDLCNKGYSASVYIVAQHNQSYFYTYQCSEVATTRRPTAAAARRCLRRHCRCPSWTRVVFRWRERSDPL